MNLSRGWAGRRPGRTQLLVAASPLVCMLAVTPSGEVVPADTATGRRALFNGAGSPLFTPARAASEGGATPKAYDGCGPDAQPETGLQGQVPLADQNSARSRRGYRCNVRRLSRNDIGLRGQNFQLAWYGDCAYVSTIGMREDTGRASAPAAADGIAVVDAADPKAPKLVHTVRSPLAKSSHEAVEVNQARGLLVAAQGGLQSQYLEVYDVKADCRKPRYLGRYDAGLPMIHGLRVADDGRTAYVSDVYDIAGMGQVIHAVDISDPTHPTRLQTFAPEQAEKADQHGVHDVEVNTAGTRVYAGTTPVQVAAGALVAGPPSTAGGTSLKILDTSELQDRKPGGTFKEISRLALTNIGHTVQRATIRGKPHLLVSGEAPFGGPQNCPWAWGHIVDISDERNPRRVSDIKLEVNDIANCSKTSRDDGAIYSIHYVGVDSEQDTKLVFYTYYTGGLRVFDVRDPAHPKEVGYYQPPPTAGTTLPAATGVTPDAASRVFDHTTSVVRYRPETGEIWVVSVNAGFQILQLTGAPAQQQATLRVPRRRARDAARTGLVPVEVNCAQPCRARVRLRVGARRTAVREVLLPRDGSGTVRVRLDARTRRALRHSSRSRAVATATIDDRLTGERQLSVASPARRFGR